MKTILVFAFSLLTTANALVLDGGHVGDAKTVWGQPSVKPGPSYEAYMVPTERVVSPGTTTPGTDRDRTIETTTSAIVAHEARVFLDATLEQTAILTNETPGIATLDGVQLTRVSDGTAKVLVSNGSYQRRLTAPISQVGGQSATIDTGWTAGSFAKNVIDWFTSAVSGKTAGSTTMSLPATGSKNTNLWTGSLDLSSIVVQTSTGWAQGCLIADRVVCVAAHVGAGVGTVYTFRRHDTGALVTATADAVSSSPGGDLLFVRLSAAPGPGVTPAKLLPADMSAYWQTKYGNVLRPDIPVLKVKRVGGLKLGIGMVQHRGINATKMGVSGPRPEALAPWYVEWHGGDSGSVVGTVNGGQFIFLGNAWEGPNDNDDGASYLPAYYSQMNTILSGWGQTVTYAQIAGMPYDYSFNRDFLTHPTLN